MYGYVFVIYVQERVSVQSCVPEIVTVKVFPIVEFLLLSSKMEKSQKILGMYEKRETESETEGPSHTESIFVGEVTLRWSGVRLLGTWKTYGDDPVY